MEKDYRVHFKFKLEYLKLALEISILRFQGFDPRESLLKKARELGRLAKVSEHEIKNLWATKNDNLFPYSFVSRYGLICSYGFLVFV